MTNLRSRIRRPEKARSVLLLATLVSIIFVPSCSRSSVASPNNSLKIAQETIADDVDEGRKLSDYDYGGKQSCGNFRENKDSVAFGGEINVRDFIYQHWNERRKGYISYSCNGTDVQNTTYYFVEPRNGDKWSVIEKSLSRNISANTRVLEASEFDDVKRIGLDNELDSYIELIKPNGEVKPIPFRRTEERKSK